MTSTYATAPRHKGLPELPVYENMSQASAHSGVPLETLKEDKKKGCPAFMVGNRFSLKIYLAWKLKRKPVKDSNGEDVLSLNEEKALQIRQTRLDQEREARVREGELVEKVWYEKDITEKFILPLTAAFNDAPTSLSARANPDNPELAREVIAGWCDGCKRQLREGLKE